uniref:Ig-like domain-containing protein n=1 Tax=Clastoptera arizonana TaxID=38151 RepID=A0A1B6DCG8_9HEMI
MNGLRVILIFLLLFHVCRTALVKAGRSAINSTSPRFTTKGKTYQLVSGETLVLPCVVDNLGSYVILWRRRNVVLTAQNLMVARDPRYSLVNGFNLQITNIEPKDAGDYSCQIADEKTKDVVHNVEVLVPPSIQSSPHATQLVTKKGGNVTLECKASGNPMPNVHWTRKDKPELFHQKIEGFSITLEKVDHNHSGVYRCTANNGVGSPVSLDLKLNVLYAPEIEESPTWVHTAEGVTVQMRCVIKGEPQPGVTWYRDGTLLAASRKRYKMASEGNMHKLTISNVQVNDFGNFSCVAENSLGNVRRYWLLSGCPGRAVFRSSPYSSFMNSYNLTWVSESTTPIEEIRLLYRKLLINETYQNPGIWREIVLNNTQADDRKTGVMAFNIEILEPSSVFQAMVQTRNRYGWSDISDLYQFYTRGPSDETYDENILDLGLTASRASRNILRALLLAATATWILFLL